MLRWQTSNAVLVKPPSTMLPQQQCLPIHSRMHTDVEDVITDPSHQVKIRRKALTGAKVYFILTDDAPRN